MPITLISWAHHSIKQKLQKLPTWNNASQRKSLKKTNGHCAIEAKNDEAEEAAALAASTDSEVKLVSMESNHLGVIRWLFPQIWDRQSMYRTHTIITSFQEGFFKNSALKYG